MSLRNQIASAVLILTCLGVSLEATGEEIEFLADPYFITDQSYALDLALEEGFDTRRISTVIPKHTLVFKLKNPLILTISGQEYESIVTQYGQDLLVRRNNISKTKFSTFFGNQKIIFHQDSYLCGEEDLECDEENGKEITKGEVFDIAIMPNEIKLTAFRKESQVPIYSGYMSNSRFKDLINVGKLTDASLTYPIYLVDDFKELEPLSVRCGETKTSINTDELMKSLGLEAEVSPLKLVPFLSAISDAFGIVVRGEINRVNENTESIESNIGNGTDAIKFYAVSVKILDQKKRDLFGSDHRDFLISANIKCMSVGPAATSIYIDEMIIKEKNTIVAQLKFENFYQISGVELEELLPVHRGVKGRVFFNSVNSFSDYSRHIEIWQSELNDVGLSSIMLGLFNASCAGTGNYSRPVCRDTLKLQP